MGVDGVDGRDVGGVGAAVADAGGFCAAAFGVDVRTVKTALFRLEDEAK